MKLIRFFLLITILPVLLSARPVDRSDRKEMLKEVSKIEDLFNNFYAPKKFKEAHEGYKIETLFKDLGKTLKQKKDLTVAGYQQELQKTLGTLGDYHVGIYFYRSAFSMLPFDVMHSGGRYFITDVMEYCKDDLDGSNLEIGDELLSYNGVPIEKEILRLHYETQNRKPTLTDISLAAMRFPYRDASSGITPPKGPAEILVKKKNGGKKVRYSFDWECEEEKLPALLAPKTIGHPEMRAFGKDLCRLAEKKRSQTPFFLKNCELNLLPNQHYFPAFTFEHEGLVYGYLKIPFYWQLCDMGLADYEEAIRYLEEHTDALVIDQLGNPGGSVFFLYTLASMLTETPLVVPKHQVSLKWDEAALFAEMREYLSSIESDEEAEATLGDLFEGYPVTLEFVKEHISYIDFYLQEMEKGKKISSPCGLLGISTIKPHPRATYSKPIVMLIDELCFSGGDFMPAILQDNGRATLMGRKTAGAGGVVSFSLISSPFGVALVHLTTSIAERIDGKKIESLGVEPDIYSPITPYDIETDFEGFTDSVIKVLKRKVAEQTSSSKQ